MDTLAHTETKPVEAFPGEANLTPAMQGRVRKLIELRRKVRAYGSAATVSAAVAALPLVVFLFGGASSILSVESLVSLSPGAVALTVLLFLGWFGALAANAQLKQAKDKYDKLRGKTADMIAARSPLCGCRARPCNCVVELIKYLKEKHDINLLY